MVKIMGIISDFSFNTPKAGSYSAATAMVSSFLLLGCIESKADGEGYTFNPFSNACQKSFVGFSLGLGFSFGLANTEFGEAAVGTLPQYMHDYIDTWTLNSESNIEHLD